MSSGPGSSAPETALLSPQNPWPGLVSFSEANEAFFFGREQEIADLVRRIAQEPLTIFFGKSGLGKSSILQAGLTPELRRNAFVPIYIRLDYAAQAPPLATQALDHIRGTLDREAIDAPRPEGDQTLWEYFHAVGCDWWDHHNQLVKPILMFDQFEELLTLGRSTPAGAERIQDFLRELEDLVDNRVPSELERRLSAERGLGQQFDFNRTACHILLALREDYLADLESLHERLRPIMRNRFRLLPMNTQQAVDVILKPGKDLVDPDVALKIVQFVSSSEHGHFEPGDGDAALQVEPALLSVVLQELNNRRLQRGQGKVSEDLLGEGHAADILQHFYERGLRDLDPQVGDFIVDHLLTASGARNRIAEEDALTKPGITPRVIAILIDRRIIQRQSSGHMKWLELTHDTLADVVNRGRTEIRQRRALEAAAAREKEIHRNLVRSRKLVSLFATLALVALAGLGFAYWQHLQVMSQEKEVASRGQSLAKSQAELGKKDVMLRKNAERESAERIDALWDSLKKPEQGESERVPKELSLLMSAAEDYPDSSVFQQRNALGHALGAEILYSLGAIKAGYDAAQKASDFSERLRLDHSPGQEAVQARAAALYALGRGDLELGRYDDAQSHLQSALAVTTVARTAHPEGPDRIAEIVALTRIGLGDVNLLRYYDDDARDQYARVLDQYARALKVADGHPDDIDDILQYCEARAYEQIAISHYQDATPAADRKSDEAFRRAYDRMRQMMKHDPGNFLWRGLYLETTARQALILANMGHGPEAFRLLQPVRPMAEEVSKADQANQSILYVLVLIDRSLGKYYRASGDEDGAKFAFSDSMTRVNNIKHAEPAWIKPGIQYGLLLTDKIPPLPPLGCSEESKASKVSKAERKKALLESRAEFELLAKAAKDNAQILWNAASANLDIGTFQATEEKDYRAAQDSYATAGLWFARMSPRQRQQPSLSGVEGLRNFDNGCYVFAPQKRTTEQQEAYRRAAASFTELIKRAPSLGNYQDLAITYLNIGDAHLASGDPPDAAANAYQQALSTYDEGVSILRKQGRIFRSLFATKAEQQVRIAGQWRLQKQYQWAETNLQAAVSAIRYSLKRDIMQPELLSILNTAEREVKSLQEAVGSPVSGAEKDLLARISKTSEEINVDALLWPKGAKQNAAGFLLDVPEPASWGAPPLVAGEWVQVSSAEQVQERKRFAEADPNAEGGPIARTMAQNLIRIRKLPIAFYPDATLFEAEVRRANGGTGVFDYVRSGSKDLYLDGTSNPVHNFGNLTASDQGISRRLLRLDTVEQASQYLCFFAGALSTDDGTFRVVNSVSDLPFTSGTPLEVREKLGRVIKPFRLLQNNDGEWIAEASIHYGDAIEYAVLTLDTATQSTVAMKSDTYAAKDQPLLSEFVVDGLRILSDYPYRRNLLTAEIEKQRKANNWQAELRAERELVALIRDTEVLSSAKRAELLPPQYLRLSWLLLLSRDFKSALEASEAGLKLNPKEISLDTNRAHALLFLGRKGDAMEVYRKNIGELIFKRRWEEIILEDLDQLEKNHVSNPAFAEIRDMMRKAKPGL